MSDVDKDTVSVCAGIIVALWGCAAALHFLADHWSQVPAVATAGGIGFFGTTIIVRAMLGKLK